MGQCVWEGVCVCLLWLVVIVCVLEDRGCSHYHVVCVISRLAAAVGRLHRLPCCQHYSLPPSPAITHHTTHIHTHPDVLATCVGVHDQDKMQQNCTRAFIYIISIVSNSNQISAYIIESDGKRKKNFFFFFAQILECYWDKSAAQARLTDTDSWTVNAYSMNTQISAHKEYEKQINKACHKSMGGWWQPETILQHWSVIKNKKI